MMSTSSAAKPRVLVMAGLGLNCETETAFAFESQQAITSIVHVDDLLANWVSCLRNSQVIVIPGGFSYGDDTGSGNALANKLRNHLGDSLHEFVARGGLMLGICNGCQVLVNLGLVGSQTLGERKVAMLANAPDPNGNTGYRCMWVRITVPMNSNSKWLTPGDTFYIPVAHAEGRAYMEQSTLDMLTLNGMIAACYVREDGTLAGGEFPHSPNGSMADIAAMSDHSGQVLGTMPHFERGMLFTQRPEWTREAEPLKRQGKPIPRWSDGIKLFRNAVAHFA